MEKSIISMVMFNSYVKLPEGSMISHMISLYFLCRGLPFWAATTLGLLRPGIDERTESEIAGGL